MNKLRITGHSAEVCWAYHHAATLGEWRVDGENGAWIFTGTIREQNDYNITHSPLTVVTPNGWRWPAESVQIVDGVFTAVLKPMQ